MEIDSNLVPSNEPLSDSEEEEHKDKNSEPGLRFIQGPVYGRSIKLIGYNETVASVASNLAIINYEGDYYIGFKNERLELDFGKIKTLVSVFPSQLPKRGYTSQIVAYMNVEASPCGCAPNFKCLFAACSDDSRVVVYQPSNDTNTTNYVQVADLSQMLYSKYLGKEFELTEETLQPNEYSKRLDMLATLCVSWSPILYDGKNYSVLLTLSGKSKTSIWRTLIPYKTKKAQKPNFELVHTFLPHSNWTTISQFCPSSNPTAINDILFATGSSDGTVKLFQFQGTVDKLSVSLIKEICRADLNPVFGLSWYVDKETTLLGIAKGLEISIYDSKENSILCKTRAHTNAITEITFMHTKPTLLSSSLDGSIRSWEFARSQKQLREKRVLYQHIDGIFGIGVSPNDAVLVFLQRVPGVRDVMYEAKKPSTIIRLLPLDEEISSEDSLTHILRTYKTRLVTWDLKNRLMRHEDQYFELMRKLESEYSSVRLEIMDEHFMEAKLSRINNLVVANSLAYDGLPSHSGNSNLLSGINRNDAEIKQMHCWKSLRKFFAHYSTHSIDSNEKLSILLMADWITHHHNEVFAPLLQLAQKIYVAFECKAEAEMIDKLKDDEDAEVVLVEREKCPFCGIALGIGPYERFNCPNGHVLARCSRSFLILSTSHIWHCGCCQRKSLIFKGEDESNITGSLFEWLATEESPSCLHCGTGFSVLRFSSFMKTTRIGVK